MLSGAVTLVAIVMIRGGNLASGRVPWWSSAMLFIYMTFFSFAYVWLGAGTGALILFGTVQVTMFVAALRAGENIPPLSWGGLALAVLGLVYLVLPGVTAPDPIGAVLMSVAGIAWGLYSLSGKGVTDPLESTARNFLYGVPLVLFVSFIFVHDTDFSTPGIVLAVISGAAASGCGYVVWFAALRGLSAGRAAVVQLSVPIFAAIAGVMLLSEQFTLRLFLASVATLGGVAIVLLHREAAGKET